MLPILLGVILNLGNSLPSDVPRDTKLWEEVVGEIDLCLDEDEIAICENGQKTDVRLRYSLSVDPDRPLLYAITRYQYTTLNPKDRDKFDPNEKVQWVPAEREVYFYERATYEDEFSGRKIRYWKEIRPTSSKHFQTLFEIMLIYNIHRSLLE
jgi:hypothetical protein